jgi:hypothetical protein
MCERQRLGFYIVIPQKVLTITLTTLSFLLIAWELCMGTTPMMETERLGMKRECMDCHRLPNIMGIEGVKALRALCLECHAKESCTRQVQDKKVSLLVREEYFERNPHKYVACIECHRDVARSPHRSSNPLGCLNCHPHHGESASFGPHLIAGCETCHFVGESFKWDKWKNMLTLSDVDKEGSPLSYSQHKITKELNREVCNRCHFKGNQVAAPAFVLPGKGLLCLMCHYSGLTLGNWIFWVSGFLFILGILGAVFLWIKGAVGNTSSTVHEKIRFISEQLWSYLGSKKIFTVFKAFLLDVLLERRLLQESVKRWIIHTLIYWGFLFRFAFGIVSVFICGIFSKSDVANVLLNKDHPFVAFVNDLAGASILAAILVILFEKLFLKTRHVGKEFQDFVGVVLIGIIISFGFVLEAVRYKLLSAFNIHQQWAFVGYCISQILPDLNMAVWQEIFGVAWYVHSVSWAVMIAYIPLGKMRHVFVTPINLVIEGSKGE